MSALLQHLEDLKEDRRNLVERIVASGDRVANIKGLATLQGAIAAFEAVLGQDSRRTMEESCSKLRRIKFRLPQSAA